ncbi:hypothetical protein [Parapedobacter koreensis]|uniref:hypothetical protein n=1 Tax=Parapedobacter koreensis TaxID=332977 RepID=UPI000B898D79|nr:hypothetical protein [Parapedobacter koreensis]
MFLIPYAVLLFSHLLVGLAGSGNLLYANQCRFFGHMADTYYAHHVGMHHAENNLKDDKSSTMSYQRDSLKSFLVIRPRCLFEKEKPEKIDDGCRALARKAI